MIKWAASQYLYLLFSIPLVILGIIVAYAMKKRSFKALADAHLIPQLADTFNARLWWLKSALLIIGLLFLILGLARPKWGEKLQIYKGRGIDIVLCLDASKSMNSQDIKPSRLGWAKMQVSSLLDNLSTNQVAITAFAGDCYVMCPMTSDIEAAKLFLDIIEPNNIPKPGTNIQRAVEVSGALFNPKQGTSKALILVTDGDNLEGDPMTAVKQAAELGIRLYIIGIGTLQGSTIPETDSRGNLVAYKKDTEDKIVVSRLAERLLLVMAKTTDGRYYRAEGFSANNLVSELESLKKKELEGGEYVDYVERYQYFLMISFVLIFLGLFISDRRGKWFPNMEMSRFKLFILIFIFCIINSSAANAGVGSNMRAGNKALNKGNIEQALEKYQEALIHEPDNEKIHYNIGRALYKLQKYPEAISEFQLGLLTKDKSFQAKTFYNIGNCHFKQGKLDEAVNSYVSSLLLNPSDMKAKQNLEFCLKQKEDQQSQNDSTKQDQQQKPQQQDQNKQPGQQPKPQPQKGQLSKDEADRILQALQNKEKENMKKQQEQPAKTEKVDKDW
ncbi:MAG: tetratricopeptide repeat protein [Candidatus Edwardsbacteria bacterium]|nr:tetratricopeptide repeat protein [Candidatus Edwardsbacteria bacterium]MBU2595134.1 tetratricopeptide repeat protein [Candidatus Edwardsbacteria bacterium]